MRSGRFIMVALPLALAIAAFAPADTRTDNIDVMVALDRSLSMEQKIGSVQNYVTGTLIDQVLIPGDFFVVVAFYGKAEVVVSQFVRTPEDKATVKAAINRLRGNGRWTDIGNALDALKEQIAKYDTDGRRKYVLLITDGIPEPPPGSKYWSKDGSFNHAFLENTKTIQEKGWKIQILGIGTDTAARDLARALEGAYGELTGPVSADAIRAQTENLLGTIAVVEGSTKLGPVSADGTAELSLALVSKGYSNPVTVTLSSVQATPSGRATTEALARSPTPIEVGASGTTTARIALRLPAGLPSGASTCGLAFQFAAGESFSPAAFTLPLTVRGWIGNNPLPSAGIGVSGLLVLAALVVLALRLARGPGMRFSVLLDDKPIDPAVARLARGGKLYLTEREGSYALGASRTGRAIATLAVIGSRLSLQLLKPDRFPKAPQLPPDARGASLTVRSTDGTRHSLKIKAKEG